MERSVQLTQRDLNAHAESDEAVDRLNALLDKDLVQVLRVVPDRHVSDAFWCITLEETTVVERKEAELAVFVAAIQDESARSNASEANRSTIGANAVKDALSPNPFAKTINFGRYTISDN